MLFKTYLANISFRTALLWIIFLREIFTLEALLHFYLNNTGRVIIGHSHTGQFFSLKFSCRGEIPITYSSEVGKIPVVVDEDGISVWVMGESSPFRAGESH